jgi:hypothetical protein
MGFVVEKEGKYRGLSYVVIFCGGYEPHRCGYVGIGKDHRLFGFGYSDRIPGMDRKEIERMEVGDRGVMTIFCEAGREGVSPALYFDVHGGITLATGEGKYPIETGPDIWWYGFDCAHCNDTIEHWTMEAVESECKQFADQLADPKWYNEVR